MALTKKKFRDINFPSTYKYSSDSEHIPLEFYLDVFPVAKKVDLLLGYFSTNAFKVLASGFAQFIYNGGSMRIVTNHILSQTDKENLLGSNDIDDDDIVINIFEDIEKLTSTISEHGRHFFDCLKYLKSKGRLEIVPVKFNGVDLAHCKKMILFDGDDYISTDGSINFTLSALTRNSESFEVNAPWEGAIFENRTKNEKANFEEIVTGKHPDYKYLKQDEVESIIDEIGRTKEELELIEDSFNLDFSNMANKVKRLIHKNRYETDFIISKSLDLPHFPFEAGPRDYQVEAYKEWCKNNKSGVFAMATGTGKTITSLNCLLQEYKKSKTYNAIILVPSIALLNQWEEEVKSFNFKKILKVGGGNNWEKDLANYSSNYSWGLKNDLIIISTYGSFVLDRFQKLFQKIQEDFLLIADEAHNMGANNIQGKLNDIKVNKKIGLSATPKRIYDPEGTLAIDSFFNDSPPYTYSFGMEMALEFGFLTGYKYYPLIVELTDYEFEEYTEISKKLLKFFDFEKEKFKDDPIVEILLLKRKNIIHKATNKLDLFSSIVKRLIKNKKDKFVFAYIPEGNTINNDGDTIKILNQYLKRVHKDYPNLKMNSYTSEDQSLDEVLRGFEDGKIEILFAMKMLDEGVDVPRAEVGIFASSTGNPRQFIQRRGRLLRKHKDKAFATIYDMVVIPKLESNLGELFSIEKNLVKNELNRVAYFASLAMNFYDSKEALEDVCMKYDLDLDTIINDL